MIKKTIKDRLLKIINKKVTIVILNWNGKEDTLECLESLNLINYKNYEVLVVDNGSTDRSSEVIKTKFPNVKLIENEKNRGFTGGNNQGIVYAIKNNSDYVLSLNNDTVVDHEFLTELVKVAEKHPMAGIIGPKIIDYKTGRIEFVGGKIRPFNLKGPFIAIGWGEKDSGQYSQVEEYEWFTGCCWLIPVEVFNKVGLLDENYFAYIEDKDFSIRVRKRGYKVLFCPKAKIWHKGTASSGGYMSPLAFYLCTRNKITFVLKHGNFTQKFFFIFYMYTLYPILALGYSILKKKFNLIKPFYCALLYHLNHKEYYIRGNNK
jgi:GT2 family glycosyltransferase